MLERHHLINVNSIRACDAAEQFCNLFVKYVGVPCYNFFHIIFGIYLRRIGYITRIGHVAEEQHILGKVSLEAL